MDAAFSKVWLLWPWLTWRVGLIAGRPTRSIQSFALT